MLASPRPVGAAPAGRAARRAARPARGTSSCSATTWRRATSRPRPARPRRSTCWSTILGDGPTSRLYRQLVEEKNVAANAGASYLRRRARWRHANVYAVAGDGVKQEALEQAIDEVLAQFIKEGPNEEELEQAKNSLIASYVYSADNQAGLAQRYGSNLVIGRTIADIEEWPDRLGQGDGGRRQEGRRQVSRPAVVRDRLPHPASRRRRGCRQDAQGAAPMSHPAQPELAETSRRSAARACACVLAMAIALVLAWQGRRARRRHPAGALARAASPPGWWRRRACRSSPSASPSTAAARRSRRARKARAGLLAAMLDQGAGNLSGPAYQKQMEKLAARISFDSDRDAFFGNFETLTANLGKASELLQARRQRADAGGRHAGAHARPVPGAGLASRRATPTSSPTPSGWRSPSPGHAYSRAISGTPDSIKVDHARRSRRLSQAHHGQADAARRGRRRHRCGDARQGAGRGVRRLCRPSRS